MRINCSPDQFANFLKAKLGVEHLKTAPEAAKIVLVRAIEELTGKFPVVAISAMVRMDGANPEVEKAYAELLSNVPAELPFRATDDDLPENMR